MHRRTLVALATLIALALPTTAHAADHVRAHNTSQAEAQRRSVIRYITGSSKLTTKQPAATRNVTNHALAGWANLRSADRLTDHMGHGFVSRAYLLHPIRSNHRLMVFHGGHGAGWEDPFYNAAPRYFLAKGYTVLALSMPLYGMNSYPAWLGDVKTKGHDTMKGLRRPLRYFLEPVTVALNRVLRSHWRSVSMTGISGGGWTTMVYAAIDPRVRSSFPVAGGLPISLRTRPELADLEQRDPGLMRRADYTELFILGSLGRREHQFFNVHDPCCFSGTRGRQTVAPVRSALRGLGGGRFGVTLDWQNREHSYTPMMLATIDTDIR